MALEFENFFLAKKTTNLAPCFSPRGGTIDYAAMVQKHFLGPASGAALGVLAEQSDVDDSCSSWV